MLSPAEPAQNESQRHKKNRLIQLRRMPADSIAEIDTPWQTGRNAIGPIGQAAGEASNASDSDADGERHRE